MDSASIGNDPPLREASIFAKATMDKDGVGFMSVYLCLLAVTFACWRTGWYYSIFLCKIKEKRKKLYPQIDTDLYGLTQIFLKEIARKGFDADCADFTDFKKEDFATEVTEGHREWYFRSFL